MSKFLWITFTRVCPSLSNILAEYIPVHHKMYSEYQDLLQQYEWLECECIIRICVKLDIVRYMNIEVYEYNNACDNGISMGAATIPGDLFASPGK